MAFLVDRELKDLLQPKQPANGALPRVPPLVSATTPEIGKWNSKIQPASLDLTVGRILLPMDGTDAKEALHTEPSLSLAQGETVVVETHEYLTIPRTIAAIGFPPAAVSRDGLLMTNPGHIDPGFSGRLKFTVINLGKKPIELTGGKPICTLLFFSIDAPDYSYDQLNKSDKPESPSDEALLRRLSKDFLNVSERVQKSAASEVKAAQINTPVIAAIVAVLLTIAANMVATYLSGVNDLKVKIEGIEKTLGLQDVKTRIEKLEKRN